MTVEVSSKAIIVILISIKLTSSSFKEKDSKLNYSIVYFDVKNT